MRILFYIQHQGGDTPGGTDLERGYGDVRPWRLPFHTSSAARKGPISSKRVNSQDPLLRKFWNFSLNRLNFHPKFSSQAPKFGNFQLTSPQIWKCSANKPPNLEIFQLTSPPFQRQMSVRKPHTSENPGHTPLPEKKLSAPLGWHSYQSTRWFVGHVWRQKSKWVNSLYFIRQIRTDMLVHEKIRL